MPDTGRIPLAWLIPRPDEPGADLARRTQLRISISLVLANLLGALIVFAIGVWVLPASPGVEDEGEVRIVNLIAIGIFFVVVTPIAITIGRRRLSRAINWLLEDREPSHASAATRCGPRGASSSPPPASGRSPRSSSACSTRPTRSSPDSASRSA